MSQAPRITISIPISDSARTFSSLNKTPRKVPTIGVKYVGINARTVPVRFKSVPNNKNANPEPRASRITVDPSRAKLNLVERDGKFLEVLHAVEDAPAWLPQNPPLGTRLPVQQQAQKWLASSLDLVEHGSLTIFDYCMTTQIASTKPWRDWLRTYRQHELGGHYLSQPGEQDITSHVMIDQLEVIAKPTSISRQADWLIEHGLNTLVEEGRTYWQAHAAKPDLQAMLMRSRVSESESLCALDGLGNFTVLEWRK